MPAITVSTRPDGVAVLTFDQPGSKANVLTRELWAEFGEALAALAPDPKREGGETAPAIQGLVLASAKPDIFIAGADLKLLANAPGPNDPDVRAFIAQGSRVLERLEALPFPTCAAIDGAALGGGLEVALACDYRVRGTNPKVQLGLPEVKLGLIPGWGGTQRLPRLIGVSAAVAALHSGLPFESAELAATVPSDGLIAAAAQAVGRGDWRAARDRRRVPLPADRQMSDHFYKVTRESVPRMYKESVAARLAAAEAVYRGGRVPLPDALALETEAFLTLAGSKESNRLIAAFFAARKK
jgi:enoyl-CoA hydratase/carnithine racemase